MACRPTLSAHRATLHFRQSLAGHHCHPLLHKAPADNPAITREASFLFFWYLDAYLGVPGTTAPFSITSAGNDQSSAFLAVSGLMTKRCMVSSSALCCRRCSRTTAVATARSSPSVSCWGKGSTLSSTHLHTTQLLCQDQTRMQMAFVAEGSLTGASLQRGVSASGWLKGKACALCFPFGHSAQRQCNVLPSRAAPFDTEHEE